MDRPIAPTEPKKPRKPNKDNIMPQKPSRFYLVSLGTLLITGAIAAGMTIYSVFFYMGKIELPIIWLLTSILYMISYVSGGIAFFAICVALFFIYDLFVDVKKYLSAKKKYKKDLNEYNNNFDSFMAKAQEKYDNDMIIYKTAYKEYQRKYKKYIKDLKDYEYQQNRLASVRNVYSDYGGSSYTSDTTIADTSETQKREPIYLRDGSGSSINAKIEDGKLTENNGYGLRYYVDEEDGRISGLTGGTKGYLKPDGTITDIDGWTKGRITSDGRVVDNCGNTIANSVDELDKVIENLNNL